MYWPIRGFDAFVCKREQIDGCPLLFCFQRGRKSDYLNIRQISADFGWYLHIEFAAEIFSHTIDRGRLMGDKVELSILRNQGQI